MADTAINVRDIGKRYRIGVRTEVPRTRGRALMRTLASPFRYLRTSLRRPGEDEVIWALKRVSFSVERGEVVGIIGRNGAGKSTLLKILARVTEPTEGSAEIHGRVGSLLEVGTGFHPELTGRENIYLNGAILGMRKAEIERKFDQIVAFAEVERFMDTPVKRYSSGMRVRLAFAVAAHLEPEILLVDEVLAVGDVAFRNKCLGKMEEVAKEGRTVLFVSHNMGAISSLTSRCLYLDNGRLKLLGRTQDVIESYLVNSLKIQEHGLHDVGQYRRERSEPSRVRFVSIWANDERERIARVPVGEDFRLNVTVESDRTLAGTNITFSIKRPQGTVAATLLSYDSDFHADLRPGLNTFSCALSGLHLMPGLYTLDVGIGTAPQTYALDVVSDYPCFEVVNVGDGCLTYRPERPGLVVADNVSWTTERE